ncbi:AP2/ERF domain-containing protein [Dioscorea alata]|uniref:AP2/ERF domain-containing protein n=1 Tax=Dioscorea alata TaxID=55571 RepID=A0ACB7UVA6_DIOAL|nr:AP2/ERF domain-containing protein [Dioscorea alata]
MDTFSSDSGSPSAARRANSDEETYLTVSSAPPKRRAGRTKFRETRHPIYKGVRRRNSDRWVCEVREPNKKSRIWLGTFPTAEMAARAHDVAAIALRGRSATLNFADSAWRLPVPDSTSPRDIQKAAAEAAEAFRPSCSDEAALRQDNVIDDCSYYVDNELELGMQGYLDMAQGMLIDPPPPPTVPFSDAGDSDGDADVPLWSYSF